MPRERFIISDDQFTERFKFHISLKREDSKVLELILKKILRLTELEGPVHVDLTQNEMDFARELWESMKKNR